MRISPPILGWAAYAGRLHTVPGMKRIAQNLIDYLAWNMAPHRRAVLAASPAAIAAQLSKNYNKSCRRKMIKTRR